MNWSKRDHDLAERVIHAVLLGDGELVGSKSVAREVGLEFGYDLPSRSRRIYRIMPLAVQKAPVMYPGYVLIVYPDRTYRMINKSDPEQHRTQLARLQSIRTKTERLKAETLSDDPVGVWVAGVATGVLGIISPEFIEAAHKLLAASDTPQALAS